MYDLHVRCASPTRTYMYANYDIVGEPTTYDVTRIPRTLSEVEVYSVEPTTYDVHSTTRASLDIVGSLAAVLYFPARHVGSSDVIHRLTL